MTASARSRSASYERYGRLSSNPMASGGAVSNSGFKASVNSASGRRLSSSIGGRRGGAGAVSICILVRRHDIVPPRYIVPLRRPLFVATDHGPRTTDSLATPIRRAGVAREQQRDVIMALFFHDLELDHDFAEESDIAALLAEVGRHIEGKLICPNRQRR